MGSVENQDGSLWCFTNSYVAEDSNDLDDPAPNSQIR